jgi:phage gp29-like protein
MEEIELLKVRFSEIEELFENGEEDHQLIFDLEEKLEEIYDEVYEDEHAEQLDKLKKKIIAFKREYEFYDAEAELDRMFPDRHDEDFDEDQMSWDSVFGD